VPRPQRKSKSSEALKKVNDNPILISAIAQLFWSERKVDKGRDWTERALLLNPDIGDIWAMYYSYELQHDPNRAAEILKRAVAQEPRHGERWQQVAKDPANAHQPLDVILKRVVLHMEAVSLP
jgi:pre-mRNA-processing factor 6